MPRMVSLPTERTVRSTCGVGLNRVGGKFPRKTKRIILHIKSTSSLATTIWIQCHLR